jgi:uncharacterized membrane protein YedE/YeeE
MYAVILIIGFLFSAILQYANLNRYNVISGMATLENFAIAKAIAVAIGTGAIIIAIETNLGFATYHLKPLLLIGAFLSGIVISLLRKEFRLTIIHSNWEKYIGNSVSKRLIWSFIGGFILIIGARMAGGCTSGHILSGGMQLSISSLVFAVFVFTALIITGKLFYKNRS